jgi:hypothetical protein
VALTPTTVKVAPGYVVFQDPGYTDDQLATLKDGSTAALRNSETGLMLIAYASYAKAEAAAKELMVLQCERASLCEHREGAVQTLKRWHQELGS